MSARTGYWVLVVAWMVSLVMAAFAFVLGPDKFVAGVLGFL